MVDDNNITVPKCVDIPGAREKYIKQEKEIRTLRAKFDRECAELSDLVKREPEAQIQLPSQTLSDKLAFYIPYAAMTIYAGYLLYKLIEPSIR